MKKFLILVLSAALLVGTLASCASGGDTTEAMKDYEQQKNYLIDEAGNTFYFAEAEGEAAILTGYVGKATTNDAVEIPEKFGGRTVTGIGDEAFYNLTSVVSVKIPKTVTSIGDHAFAGCTELTVIDLPAGLLSIGEAAFYGCTKLETVNWRVEDDEADAVPAIQTIGKNAFRACTALANITLPASLKTVGQAAFWECTALTAVEFPASVESIGDLAFYNCTGLQSIKLHDGFQEENLGLYIFSTTESNLKDRIDLSNLTEGSDECKNSKTGCPDPENCPGSDIWHYVYHMTEIEEDETDNAAESDTDPVETDPAETDPAETDPAETDPADTEPAETKPVETKPVETEPQETEPADPNQPTAFFPAEDLMGFIAPPSEEKDNPPVLSNDGEYITITPATADHYYYPFGEPAHIDGDRYVVVKYRTQNAGGSTMQIYITDETIDNDNDMLEMSLIEDGEWHLAIFDALAVEGQKSDLTGASATLGSYDGSLVASFRLDALDCGYKLDADGKIQYVENADGTITYTRNEKPDGIYIDIAYVAFFNSAEAAEAYEFLHTTDYVTDGLVSMYQGGTGTVWEDMISGNDVTLTVDDKNYLTEDGLYLDTMKQYFPEEIVDLINGDAFTVEITLSDIVSIGADYNTFLNSGNDNFALFHELSKNYIMLKWAGQPNSSDIRPLVGEATTLMASDLTLTVTFEVDGTTAVYANGVVGTERAATQSMGADDFFIGQVDRKAWGALVKCVRFYDRALTAEEVAANAAVDAAARDAPDVGGRR